MKTIIFVLVLIVENNIAARSFVLTQIDRRVHSRRYSVCSFSYSNQLPSVRDRIDLSIGRRLSSDWKHRPTARSKLHVVRSIATIYYQSTRNSVDSVDSVSPTEMKPTSQQDSSGYALMSVDAQSVYIYTANAEIAFPDFQMPFFPILHVVTITAP